MTANIKRRLGMTMGLGIAVLCAPMLRATPSLPRPGALNYVEGQASIGNHPVNSKAVGSSELNSGDVLSTGNGHAEMLLTPGVYLRLAKDSAVRMVSPELTNTQVDVLRGVAMVEVDQIHHENEIRVGDNGSSTELRKNGIYEFDADRPLVRVFDGKARVYEGDQYVDLGKGRETSVAAPLKSEKFDRKAAKETDELYKWSSLRSEYLAEASAATAQTYVVNNAGWFGPGWYWNPFWGTYSFVPGSVLYSPFGWGLYSPFYAVRTPVYFYRPQPHYYYGGGRPAIRPAPSVGGMRGRIGGRHR